jgi:hypothetical protein
MVGVVTLAYVGLRFAWSRRLGLNWFFLKNTSAGISICFYDFGKADWIEYTIGQRWRWG